MDIDRYLENVRTTEAELNENILVLGVHTFSLIDIAPPSLKQALSFLHQECLRKFYPDIVEELESKPAKYRITNPVALIDTARKILVENHFQNIHDFYALTSVAHDVHKDELTERYLNSYKSIKGIFEDSLIVVSKDYHEIDRNIDFYPNLMNLTEKQQNYPKDLSTALHELGHVSLLLAEKYVPQPFTQVLYRIADDTINLGKKIKVFNNAYSRTKNELEDGGFFANTQLHIDFPIKAAKDVGNSLKNLKRFELPEEIKHLAGHLQELSNKAARHVDKVAPYLNAWLEISAGRDQ